MRAIVIVLLSLSLLFSFEDRKIENLMGDSKFKTYNKLLTKIFPKKEDDIYKILVKLKDNGLLDLFFDKVRLVHTRFIFKGGENILNLKLLNDSLISMGYYYFYLSQVDKLDDQYMVEIEFKSEHYIDPVSLIDEMRSRGCKILDVGRDEDVFNYIFSCENPIIKEAKKLENRNRRYINSRGVYWLENNGFKTLIVRTKKIDYWHPSIWFYDKELNLLDRLKIDKKRDYLKTTIPDGTVYIKIRDIYSGENFKRGIIVRGENKF